MTRGHLLLIPHQHAQHIEDLPTATVAHLFHVGGQFSAAWRHRGAIPATNLMLNNGKAANQHVPHIPRRSGDSWLLVWRYLTRFLNPLPYLGREQRLVRQAAQLQSLLPGTDSR